MKNLEKVGKNRLESVETFKTIFEERIYIEHRKKRNPLTKFRTFGTEEN